MLRSVELFQYFLYDKLEILITSKNEILLNTISAFSWFKPHVYSKNHLKKKCNKWQLMKIKLNGRKDCIVCPRWYFFLTRSCPNDENGVKWIIAFFLHQIYKKSSLIHMKFIATHWFIGFLSMDLKQNKWYFITVSKKSHVNINRWKKEPAKYDFGIKTHMQSRVLNSLLVRQYHTLQAV